MLLDKLNKTCTAKIGLRNVQERFYAELDERFPVIMNSDMAKVTNELEKELQLLLCCSLKYESIKIALPAERGNYRNDSTIESIVNVQRSEKGFYYPGSERGLSDIHYMDTENYIKDNNDMWRKYVQTSYDSHGKSTDKNMDILRIALSELQSPRREKRIIPDKLDAYYKFLREVMAYRPKFLCYTEENYLEKKGIEFSIGKLEFRMLERSFNLRLRQKKKKWEDRLRNHPYSRFSYNPDSNDLYRLLDYSEKDMQGFGPHVHMRLKLFMENYEAIKARLVLEEARKKKAYDTCQRFLKQMRVHTLPFKVLGELKQ